MRTRKEEDGSIILHTNNFDDRNNTEASTWMGDSMSIPRAVDIYTSIRKTEMVVVRSGRTPANLRKLHVFCETVTEVRPGI